jgi:phosphoesterase RecJ-like protein
MDKNLVQQARIRIEAAERIMICAHIRPDGDAVGSVAGLGLALIDAGKTVQMVLADGVPAALRFIPGSDQIVNQPGGEFDLIIAVDCGSRDRIGRALEEDAPVHINLDHHPDNTLFGEINLVDPAAVSATEILSGIFPAWGLALNPEIASALLAGLITDTIGFKTGNMRPDTLRTAADLFEAGANLPELYHKGVAEKSFPAARYMGTGLAKLSRENGLVWTSLSLTDRKTTNYPGRDDADLVNILSAIDSAEVAMIFVEQHNQEVKISWRTRDKEIDVSAVAHQFGGGGHRAAAGATVPGELDDVQTEVLNRTKEIIFKS